MIKENTEIKICPFRTYKETIPAILKGQGDFVKTGFMRCLKGECPAFYVESGDTFYREYCKRLSLEE